MPPTAAITAKKIRVFLKTLFIALSGSLPGFPKRVFRIGKFRYRPKILAARFREKVTFEKRIDEEEIVRRNFD
jgi:hypothetical protein